MKVTDNYSLGNKAKITIIEVDQQALVLGVTKKILPCCIK
ncbi:MAG: flagellar biosynthetic protein FliO [Arsenophonus endosymbiont of Dermacentor nuttalli]